MPFLSDSKSDIALPAASFDAQIIVSEHPAVDAPGPIGTILDVALGPIGTLLDVALGPCEYTTGKIG